MVTFTCDWCQESVKKAKVKNHQFSCGSDSFSCVDCSKTFLGNSVHAHTSCISEAEKYQGKLYRGKKQGDNNNNNNNNKNNNNQKQAEPVKPAPVEEKKEETKKEPVVEKKSKKRTAEEISSDSKAEESKAATSTEIDYSALVQQALSKGEMSMKKLRKAVLKQIEATQELDKAKKSEITNNLLAALLDMPVSLSWSS
eukprot:TRINITY_DN3229_c0_g1_i2.p1 TRINITY_DN3229_c0_g1~~TRINITY_DN3229_c0_g1_i2.p1  ORF type:complete len:198 (+),score=72.63 TRINITY_DN3229_c0_g1_i2:105-698(+)